MATTKLHLTEEHVGECTAEEAEQLIDWLNEHSHQLEFEDENGFAVTVDDPWFVYGDSLDSSIWLTERSWADAINTCFDQDSANL